MSLYRNKSSIDNVVLYPTKSCPPSVLVYYVICSKEVHSLQSVEADKDDDIEIEEGETDDTNRYVDDMQWE